MPHIHIVFDKIRKIRDQPSEWRKTTMYYFMVYL